jgi:hypothetical protein
MRLKVDESLHITKTEEAVPRNKLWRMARAQF